MKLTKKKINKILDNAFQEKAELSTNKGRFDRTKSIKPNSKTRRHSGRKEVFVDDEDYPYQEVFYDDWNDYRDGFRDIYNVCFQDDETGKTIINTIENLKRIKKEIKKKENIRKLRKGKLHIKSTKNT